MKSNAHNRLVKRALFGIGLVACASGYSGPITLSQTPAGTSAREPAPNIIISVDDSGSMGWDANGCQTMDYLNNVYANTDDPSNPANVICPGRAVNPNPSRIADLRAALRSTFGNPNTGDKGILEDGRIRLAWQTLDDRNAGARPIGQQNDQDSIQPGGVNALRSFTGQHRTNFENFVSSLQPSSLQGTSLHRMMSNVDTYMRSATGVNNPYANVPGSDSNALSCRRTYHILMTDGAWNSENLSPNQAGNVDGTFGWSFPNGTTYADTAQTNVYKDTWGGLDGTLADWSLRLWATDYRTDLSNDIRQLWRVIDKDGNAINETVGNNVLQPFWNPKNNPMNWQGITTYTIGFSRSAITWAGGPAWDNVNDDNFGAGYVTKVNNTTQWLDLFNATQVNNRGSDLWHAALNGRGRYFPARTSTDLRDAFENILRDILTQTAKPLVSIATSSSRASANNFAYVAGYDSEANWKGSLAAYPISETTGRPSTVPAWTAQELLDAASNADMNNRVILTHDGTQGRGFRWDNLNATQQMAIRGSNTVPVGTGTARINYLRGDRSLEGSAGYMRTRSSRLGDIVNSNIWHLGKPTRLSVALPGHAAFRTSLANRTATLYVGANDGMLHAFNAKTGKELMAYVPAGLFGTQSKSPLRELTQTTYSHRYYVDGHPFTGDVNVGNLAGSIDWRTLLVGSLGAGGKGYFVLDVTNPSNFVDPGAGVSALVKLDTTVNTDPEVGHIFAAPVLDDLTRSQSEQIVRVNDNVNSNGRWAVILGNGYNSTNERPTLVIQYLDGSMTAKYLQASLTTNQGNGLGAPRPIDLNGDGKIDIVYAGDLKGNLWKFDLTSSNPDNWKVAFSGNPLIVAKDPQGATQPITAAPYWQVGPNNLGGIQVLFGTGSNISTSDPGSTQIQTVYSVWDNSKYTWSNASPTVTAVDGSATSRASLVRQEQVSASANGRNFETSANGVTYSRTLATAKRGWYFDLPVSRERVLAHPSGFQGQLVLVNSVVPTSSAAGETCDLSSVKSTGYLNVFNIYSGHPPKKDVFGENNGNRVLYGSGDYALLNNIERDTWNLFTPEATCPPGSKECFKCTPGVDCPENECTPGVDCPECGGLSGRFLELCKVGGGGQRADWRELR